MQTAARQQSLKVRHDSQQLLRAMQGLLGVTSSWLFWRCRAWPDGPHLLGVWKGVSAAVVGDGEEALLDVNVGGPILAHGAQLDQVAVRPVLLCTAALEAGELRLP